MGLYQRRKFQNGNIENARDEETEHVTLSERIRHFTWAWFAFPLSTGGVALLLASTPHRFTGLTTIGKIFFIFAIVVTLIALPLITFRFIRRPSALIASLKHPTEALFYPTMLLNFANLISCSQVYGGPYCGDWFNVAMRVLFWLYLSVSFISAVGQYLHLFTAPATRLTIQGMTPAWILPIFPSMLVGTLANVIAPNQTSAHRLPIMIAGVGFQGLGWMVAFLMCAVYLHRLMEWGLPAPNLRPGMFISVGPPSFTGLALVGLSINLPTDYGYFAQHPISVEILQTVALFVAIFLWILGLWFFSVTTTAILMGAPKMQFHLVWWALVFPNVGFTLALIQIGTQLESEGILWVASAMTIVVVALWIFVFLSTVRAVLRKDILMPGKDEDKEYYKEDDEKHGVRAPF